MKQRLNVLRQRIDALSLRERAMLFAAAVAVIVFISSYLVFSPMFARQAALRAQLGQQQARIAAIDAEITARVQAHAADPDAAVVARIAAMRTETAALAERLRTMDSALVTPRQMAPLLEAMLKTNGKLRLEALATVPEAAPVAATTGAGAGTPLFYRHGVELTVSGSYADMLAYMAALEAMPTRLFWGGAKLDASAWPSARLTLSVYTLSLDPTWMRL